MTRRFNLDHPATGWDSTTQLGFTVNNELGDLHPTVLERIRIPETCDSAGTGTDRRLAHDEDLLELRKGLFVRDAGAVSAMTEEMMAIMLRLVGQGPESL